VLAASFNQGRRFMRKMALAKKKIMRACGKNLLFCAKIICLFLHGKQLSDLCRGSTMGGAVGKEGDALCVVWRGRGHAATPRRISRHWT
jgi:hypothetical protein